MKWHYVKDNDWPEETDTMCLCKYTEMNDNSWFTKYSVAMYTDFEGKKEFINHDGRCVNVDYWVKISDIEESIYFDELYAEQNNRLRV